MVPLKNARINELPVSAGPKAGYLLAMFNIDKNLTEQVLVDFFMSSGTSQNFEWAPNTAYPDNSVVTYGGLWWQAQQAMTDTDNIVPGTDDTYWLAIPKSPSGLTMWKAGVFTEDEVFVVAEVSGVKTLFYLANATRPFVSSNFTTEYANGDWEPIGAVPSGGNGNIDGGTPDSVYTIEQNTDGGNP